MHGHAFLVEAFKKIEIRKGWSSVGKFFFGGEGGVEDELPSLLTSKYSR